MNDPLCLPRTLEGWDSLKAAVQEFATKVCGACVNLRIQEDKKNDARATFTFGYYHTEFDADDREVDEINVDGIGLMTAQWDKNGKVYVAMVIEGKGVEGRWFNAPDPSGAFWIDGKPGEGRQHVGWVMKQWQASKK